MLPLAMAHEIEIKLALPASAQARFLRLSFLREATARKSGVYLNRYYDTPDGALQRQGIALRLRKAHGVWWQTVKCAGHGGGGLMTRPEWETPYHGEFDFSAVDDAVTRQRLEQPKTRLRLGLLFETNFRRNTWRFEAVPGAAVVLTLDRGWLLANGQREPISELEIELAGGTLGALFDLAQRLAQKVPLLPAMRSKAERGYRLCQGVPLSPVKASEPRLSADLSPLAAFQQIAWACLDPLQLNHAGAIVGEDPEYVHQMRVALRRLRAALHLFAPLLPEDFMTAVVPPLRALSTLLGTVRDLDVLQTERLAGVQHTHPTRPGLTVLMARIAAQRQTARAALAEALQSLAYGQWVVGMIARIHQLDTDPRPTPLAKYAKTHWQRLHKKVVQRSATLSMDDRVALHALRIACKRLRYGIAFFDALSRPSPNQKAMRVLETMQAWLGQLNDLSTAQRFLREALSFDAAVRPAVDALCLEYATHYAATLAEFPTRMHALHALRLPKLGG